MGATWYVQELQFHAFIQTLKHAHIWFLLHSLKSANVASLKKALLNHL